MKSNGFQKLAISLTDVLKHWRNGLVLYTNNNIKHIYAVKTTFDLNWLKISVVMAKNGCCIFGSAKRVTDVSPLAKLKLAKLTLAKQTKTSSKRAVLSPLHPTDGWLELTKVECFILGFKAMVKCLCRNVEVLCI